MPEDWDIVVVSHNSANDLHAWADVDEELRRRVILVDNGSTDQSAAIGRALFGRVMEQPNRGLSSANNAGAALGTARHLLFCNPDVQPEGGFEALADHLRHHPGAVSPRLVFADGTVQDNARGWPTLIKQIRNRLAPGSLSDYCWPVPADVVAPVPWTLGAAIATTRAAFEQVGGWPEEYFLYYEDTELCSRYWEAGLTVSVFGLMQWTHRWARSSRRAFSPAARMHLLSALRFYWHHPAQLVMTPMHLERQRLRTDLVLVDAASTDAAPAAHAPTPFVGGRWAERARTLPEPVAALEEVTMPASEAVVPGVSLPDRSSTLTA